MTQAVEKRSSRERLPGWHPALEGELKPSRLLAWARVIGIVLWTLWLLLLNLRTAISQRGLPSAVTMSWHRNLLKVAGVEVTTHGAAIQDRPTLLVANHASYLDILVLGSLQPCSFVSKAEVRSWPVFGWLAVQQRTIFIQRDRRQASSHLDVMKERLEEGGCLVLFPEGTSSDGSRVLPFKSTLFQTASIEFPETGEITVQPVSISYSRLDGMPMGRALRSYYTWYGDMELAGHLIDWLGLGSLGVDVIFHEPTQISQAGGRKPLAEAAQSASAAGVESALRGRPSVSDKAQMISQKP